jgi:hypothetical protein
LDVAITDDYLEHHPPKLFGSGSIQKAGHTPIASGILILASIKIAGDVTGAVPLSLLLLLLPSPAAAVSQ